MSLLLAVRVKCRRELASLLGYETPSSLFIFLSAASVVPPAASVAVAFNKAEASSAAAPVAEQWDEEQQQWSPLQAPPVPGPSVQMLSVQKSGPFPFQHKLNCKTFFPTSKTPEVWLPTGQKLWNSTSWHEPKLCHELCWWLTAVHDPCALALLSLILEMELVQPTSSSSAAGPWLAIEKPLA